MNHVELAAALFAAFENADEHAVRELCAPDLSAIQNGGPAMTLDALIVFTLAVHRVVKNFRYERPVRSATDNGFVEEHLVCGTLPDGSTLELPVCVVGEVKHGQVATLREYLDRLAAAPLAKLLAAG